MWWKEFYKNKKIVNLLNSNRNKEVFKQTIKELNLESTVEIYDQCCGAGFSTLELIKLGYNNITSVDLSEESLNILKNKLKDDNSNNIEIHCEDVFLFEPNKKFDVIINWYSSFGGFSDYDKNFEMIVQGEKFLNNNGVYLIETLDSSHIKENFKDSIVYDEGIKRISSIDNNILKQKWIIQKKPFETEMFLYSQRELEVELNKIFRSVKINKIDGRLLILCRK